VIAIGAFAYGGIAVPIPQIDFELRLL
jgi:hypothetical protein